MQPARTCHRRAAAVTTSVALVVAALGGCTAATSAGSAEPKAEPAPAISIPAEATIDGRSAGPSRSGSPDSAKAETKAAANAARVCARLQEAWTATNRALVDLSPDHPRSLVASFRDAERAVTSVEPPAEIEPAWTTMADYLGDVVTGFDDVDTDDAEAVTAAMTEAISTADTERATAAAKDVTAHLASTCGDR